MVLDYYKTKRKSRNTIKSSAPSWTSDKNKSLAAWICVEEMKREKAEYIKKHIKKTDYNLKSHYQINGAMVARAIETSRCSLMNTSRFSPHFRAYLDKVNHDLECAKKAQLDRNASRGPIKSSKKDLLSENKRLKKELKDLELMKIEKAVEHAYDSLPLPIRKKFGLS
jgi:hypothetical protein